MKPVIKMLREQNKYFDPQDELSAIIKGVLGADNLTEDELSEDELFEVQAARGDMNRPVPPIDPEKL